MKDFYPESSIPSDWLVPPVDQPDYADLPGAAIPPVGGVADHILAAGRPDGTAVVDAASGRTVSFADLDRESASLARGLVSMGVRPGDRIAFRTPNVPEMPIVALAIWRAGGVVVPTPAQARAEELHYFLEDAGAKVLLVCARPELCEEVAAAVAGTTVEAVLSFGTGEEVEFPRWHRALETELSDLPQISVDAVAVLWHTGGTTGLPKGCYHTHRRYLCGGYSLGQALDIRAEETWGAATPMGHALGFLQHTTFSLLHGARAVTIEDFHRPQSLLEAIERHRITTFTAITATWARMADVLGDGREYDTASIERGFAMWQSASSSAVFDFWKDRGVELHNNFGSTAFAAWPLVPHKGASVPRASLGPSAPGYTALASDLDADEIKSVPVGATGRLAVKGPTGLTFWRRPELQRRDVRDGWTLHDDLVSFDDQGNAAYLGRTDFLISSAGYKIAPGEVEKALSSHPEVVEVGVVGAPDPIRQEVVMAFVVLRSPEMAGEQMCVELQEHAKDEISPYKYPRLLRFVDALPRDSVGKVQTKVLARWARENVEEKV